IAERLFVWVHLLTPHLPYRPSPAHTPPLTPTLDPVLCSSALYDGEVRDVDDLVGTLVESIDRHRGSDRTMIVFTSDHGEEFGEHGSWEHGHSLHEEVTHVPLVIVAPGLAPGSRIESRIGTIDIFPTILDGAGVRPTSAEPRAGSSLLPLVSGAPAVDKETYSEGMLYGNTRRSLTAGGYRAILDLQEDRMELYQVAVDRDERFDLAASQPDRLRDLRGRLDAWQWRLSYDARRIEARKARLSIPLSDEDDASERRRIDEALRSLGYANP
ncbi:MAG TPA: sulfatase-like hydrolase/transferase, partial [Candidatus Polarisedimenticolia bacterium]|nr:sulfatase-like hydrolase/transferase [Candidatus Polarisedimenticolia bacterium]